ncbi:MAG: hypothetical protein SVP52_06515 [Chloroflexota bacterium]|nr:hypothetical protein [Chloroflexota bacterium]
MIKKTFVGLTITLILAIGVFGVVKTTYAQDDVEPQVGAAVPEPETLEYEYGYQNGIQNDDADPMLTRTRTRLFEMQEGECDADCDPQQLREQLGLSETGFMQQERLNTGEFEPTGDCVPQQSRLSEGTGYGAQRQLNSSADGSCDGTGVSQGLRQGGKNN